MKDKILKTIDTVTEVGLSALIGMALLATACLANVALIKVLLKVTGGLV